MNSRLLPDKILRPKRFACTTTPANNETGDKNAHFVGHRLARSGAAAVGEQGQSDDHAGGEHDDAVCDVEFDQADAERGGKDSEAAKSICAARSQRKNFLRYSPPTW